MTDDRDDNDHPPVRVVDRRWWARGDSAEGGDAAVRKPTYVEELEQQLADKAAHVQALITEHRRALEEFEQVKGRIRRDVGREVERGRRTVIVDLLDVLDNLERALAAAGASVADANDALRRGVELVRDQFVARLEAHGVRRVSALGAPFDASQHEAVTTTPVTDPAQDGMVVSVLKEGYAIGDELLRPASVVVGKLSGRE